LFGQSVVDLDSCGDASAERSQSASGWAMAFARQMTGGE